MNANEILSEMKRLSALVQEAKDTPEVRFQPTRYCPAGTAYMLNEVMQDERGQAYKVVLLHPDNVPDMRAAVREHLPLGMMPKGLE